MKRSLGVALNRKGTWSHRREIRGCDTFSPSSFDSLRCPEAPSVCTT